jgi:hypothetical protein
MDPEVARGIGGDLLELVESSVPSGAVPQAFDLIRRLQPTPAVTRRRRTD